MKSIVEELNWRYATKLFDSTKKLTSEQLNGLLEVVRLAPTSYGLQPFKVLIVNSPTLRKQLLKHSFGQQQIVDASHLLIFCAETILNSEIIDQYIERIATTRSIEVSKLTGYKDFMSRTLLGQSVDAIIHWNAKQIYLALGMLLQSCSKLKIDATPMEGFDAQGYIETLHLEKLNLHPVIACPIGFRSSEDSVQYLKKVRKEHADMIIQIN